MKSKILSMFLILAIFFAFAPDAAAQKGNPPGMYTQAISGDPLNLVVSETLYMVYERGLSPKNSFTIFGQYAPISKYWTGFGIGASYRWYADIFDEGNRAIKGFSFGPFASILFFNYNPPTGFVDPGNDGALLIIGGEAAYKFIIGKGFMIEPIFRLLIPLEVSVSDFATYSAIGLGVNVGYAF